MNKLSDLNKHLLIDGVKTTGSLIEGFYYNEENFFIKDYEDVKIFVDWAEKEVDGHVSSGTIDDLYNAFKNPDNVFAQTRLDEIKEQLKELHNRIGKP